VPLGAPTSLNDVIREAARTEGSELIDIAHAVANASPHGLPGRSLFADYVHPNLAGNVVIAAPWPTGCARSRCPCQRGVATGMVIRTQQPSCACTWLLRRNTWFESVHLWVNDRESARREADEGGRLFQGLRDLMDRADGRVVPSP
jgi:hypothetical protein